VHASTVKYRYLASPQVGYGFPVFPAADVPKWRQLADLIRERIASGEYQPRQAIPSEHALVQETGLSRSTVQKTLKALRDSGEVYSVQGLGTFVSPKD
jgi:GntR family transcriptional regulator